MDVNCKFEKTSEFCRMQKYTLHVTNYQLVCDIFQKQRDLHSVIYVAKRNFLTVRLDSVNQINTVVFLFENFGHSRFTSHIYVLPV